MRTRFTLPAMVLAAVAAGAEPNQAPPPLTVGLEVELADASQRSAFTNAFSAAVSAADLDRRVTPVDGCEDVSFCVTVVAVPVKLGARAKGIAVAGYVSRRFLVDSQWPWPPVDEKGKGGTAPLSIEDAYTAGGEAGCVECQSRLERLERKVDIARALVADLMVDEGDLQVAVGPSESGFVAATGTAMGTAVVERHVRPWCERPVR